MSLIHHPPLNTGWWSLLWPLVLLANGWLLETLFAHAMNYGVQTSSDTYYLWWIQGDLALQWCIYGMVSWALVWSSFHCHRANRGDSADAPETEAFRREDLTPNRLIQILVVVLLAFDISYRSQWRSPWLAGTAFQKPTFNTFFSTGAMMEPMELFEMAMLRHWQWSLRPLWPFWVFTILAWLWYGFRRTLSKRLHGQQLFSE